MSDVLTIKIKLYREGGGPRSHPGVPLGEGSLGPEMIAELSTSVLDHLDDLRPWPRHELLSIVWEREA